MFCLAWNNCTVCREPFGHCYYSFITDSCATPIIPEVEEVFSLSFPWKRTEHAPCHRAATQPYANSTVSCARRSICQLTCTSESSWLDAAGGKCVLACECAPRPVCSPACSSAERCRHRHPSIHSSSSSPPPPLLSLGTQPLKRCLKYLTVEQQSIAQQPWNQCHTTLGKARDGKRRAERKKEVGIQVGWEGWRDEPAQGRRCGGAEEEEENARINGAAAGERWR